MRPITKLSVAVIALGFPGASEAQDVATVEVSPDRASVVAGETAQFRAVAKDSKGQPVRGVELHWLATPYDIAGADSTGLVTTTRAGRVYVLAFAGQTPGMAVLDIAERGAARIEIHAADGARTVVGGSVQLEVKGHTETGDPVPVYGASWRSLDASVADVDAFGLVNGARRGTRRSKRRPGLRRHVSRSPSRATRSAM